MITKLIRGSIAGGLAFFILGYIIYGLLLAGYYAENTDQCASRPMEEMVWWSMIIANLVFGLFLTIILNWSNAKSVIDGLKTGLLIGFLYALMVDLQYYAMSTMFKNAGVIIVDIIVFTILTGLVSMVIVLLWGKPKTEAAG